MDEREQIEVDIAQLQTLIEEDDDDDCEEYEDSQVKFQQYQDSCQFFLPGQTSEWNQLPHTSSETSQYKAGSNPTSATRQSIMQYEDDRSELLSERSSMFTSDGNLETCLALNLAYQEITQETIDEVVLLLENNRTKQRILQDEMKDSMKKGQQSAEGRTFRDRSSVLFFAPYFKDSTGRCAPPNEDTLIKKANKEITAYLHPSRPWSKEDRKQLLAVVTENARELAMEQVMTRKDILSEKILQGDLNQVKSDEIEEKLKETEAEIKRIKKMSIHDLLSRVGDRLDWMKISTTNLEGLRSPEACELMWTNVVHPAIRKDKWTKAEDQRLRMIAAKWGERNWDEIAKDLHSNRTAFQCMERYQSKLNSQLQKGTWTKEEDELLFEVVMSCKVGDFIPWPQVAYYVEDRSTQQCKYRWTNALDPLIKRGKWSKEEDTMLLAAVARHGENWMKVSKYFPGRNNYRCRERYCNTLRPDIKLSNWTVPEDMLILKSVKKYGEGMDEI
ncbi:snRNA-activating protein complex subunit 4-like [Limulus polyphemus]|uniref:snRNA-activating protein complex subunit 4-like n=1 Tax=Limulus polyphemus TaxID=6850 RepID=A0ABM1BWI0_LIMPO|nr:snRNA-activating protein complex subunit 4-like [Limulus polyphemus]